MRAEAEHVLENVINIKRDLLAKYEEGDAERDVRPIVSGFVDGSEAVFAQAHCIHPRTAAAGLARIFFGVMGVDLVVFVSEAFTKAEDLPRDGDYDEDRFSARAGRLQDSWQRGERESISECFIVCTADRATGEVAFSEQRFHVEGTQLVLDSLKDAADVGGVIPEALGSAMGVSATDVSPDSISDLRQMVDCGARDDEHLEHIFRVAQSIIISSAAPLVDEDWVIVMGAAMRAEGDRELATLMADQGNSPTTQAAAALWWKTIEGVTQ